MRFAQILSILSILLFQECYQTAKFFKKIDNCPFSRILLEFKFKKKKKKKLLFYKYE